jgi:hypothetical protein
VTIHSPSCVTLPHAHAAEFRSLENRYNISFLAEDCKTPVGRTHVVNDTAALLAIVARLRGDVAQATQELKQWGRGGVWVELSQTQRRFFGIG